MYFKKHKFLTQKRAYALFCVLLSLCSFSQSVLNLVNNSSAEQFKTCSFGGGLISNVNFWYSPTGGTPDYFNSCLTQTVYQVPTNFFGSQNPRTGNAYMGFGLYGLKLSGVDFKEYLGNGLKNALKSGKSYCVTYYVSLAEYSRYACANIGFLLSQDSILNRPSTLALGLTPNFETTNIITDSINWVQIQDTYLSNGTERFITIGNFKSDINTTKTQIKPPPTSGDNAAYYYIDDISVIEINSASAAIKDSITKCALDSVSLGTDSTEFATYTWSSTAAGLAALSCTNCPNPIAKPFITTKYYLTKQQCSTTTIDSVTVVVLTPTVQANAGNDKTICIGEYTRLGTSDSLAFTNYSWQNSTSLSCSNCAMPLAFPMVSTTYTVQRTECSNLTTDTVRVIVDDCDPSFTVPNVFTPNYDDVNDTWGINFSTVNSRIKNFKMNIYDRWGLLVYSTNSELSTPNSKWDGHTTSGMECSSGVYYYIITFEKNEEHILLKGHLSLFR